MVLFYSQTRRHMIHVNQVHWGWSTVLDCGISWSYSIAFRPLHAFREDSDQTDQTCNLAQIDVCFIKSVTLFVSFFYLFMS